MNKNVLVLSSSPRRGGNSDLLCDQFVLGAKESGHQVEKIFLKDKKVSYCTGCGACLNGKKSCPQKDDMAEILNKMIAADVIVMATPVYFYTMCGQMKTVIDRTCSRYTEINDKEFISSLRQPIATSRQWKEYWKDSEDLPTVLKMQGKRALSMVPVPGIKEKL